MNNNSPGTKILMTLVCLAVLSYFGIQAYSSLTNPLVTAMAYTYQVEDSLSATGYLVRKERVLPDSGGGLLRLTRSEGERVSTGSKVAQIYSDQASLDRQNEIDRLQTQLDQLQLASEAASASEAALQLDSQIMDKLIRLRRATEADHIDNAEDYVTELKALVLRRDYTYTDAEDLKTQMTELQSQLKTLKAQSGNLSRTVFAPETGLYSAVVDGYETVLTPETLKDLTPTTFNGIQPAAVSADLGKLVLGDTWYYVANLTSADAANFTKGSSEKLRFAKGVGRDLQVTIHSMSEEDNGRVVVVFRGNTYLPQLTLLRRQSADIIRSAVSGIRVPQQAIRVSEDGVTGIYCVVGAVTRFKPVKVVWSADDEYAVVRGTGEKEVALRPGDEVILSAGGLTDGTVVSHGR